jgi:gliding motility-associated-like protein
VTAANNGPLCPGQALNLSATAITGATYSWSGPNGFTSTLQNPTIGSVTTAMAGVYTVSVNVVSPPCNSTSSTTVVVNPNPVVTVNSPTTCVGVSATLNASGATTYLWSTAATTPTITVPGTATTYTLVGTTNGCTGSAISTVTTSPPPVVSFIADKLSGCNPISVLFTANTTGNAGATYFWDFGDGTTGTGTNPSHYYTSNGCHTIILTVSFSANCTTTDSIPCMIDVFPQPEANFLVSPSEIDILTPTAFFTNMSTASSIWMWNFGDSTFSAAQNPSHTYPEIGTYPVTLYSSNADGCIDSVTYFVIINDVLTVYIPNAFTPNADGINDIFNVFSHGIDPKNFELLIFDRWGNKIFKTNDLYEGWNGAVNNHGDVVQEDVYVYRVNYRDMKGRKKKLIGHVSMVK